MKLLVLVALLLIISTNKFVLSEVFTALVDLEDLLDTEELLLDNLKNYIKAEENKINLLKRYREIYQKQHKKASENVQSYISNPLNAYTLVKRLTADWRQVEALMMTDMSHGPIQNISNYKEILKFPTDEDLNGAAVALTRLQDTYKLDTSSLARGELNGIKYSTELNAADCFELGRQSYKNEDFYHAKLWMNEAEARHKREISKTVERSDILEYLAFSTFKQGDINSALDLTNELLEILPEHDRALGNKHYYEQEIKKNKEQKKGETEPTPTDLNGPIRHQFDDFRRELYEELCRGEGNFPIEISSQLKCKYLMNKPFLKLAPIKIEQAFLDPEVYIFHDVMSDNEIKTIRKMAQPRFKRAKVQNTETGELEIAQYRISKSAWIKDFEHKHITDVARRVEDMTGLDMNVAEELQVVNYGIGGHYEPHYDFTRKSEKALSFKNFGNRIATVLFYMSDVPQGGATVFPILNLSVWPKKGTAAFWYNLHHNGDGDVRTRHAACPVLTGSKWVSNKWIHEVGQEFRRPCRLERPPEELTV